MGGDPGALISRQKRTSYNKMLEAGQTSPTLPSGDHDDVCTSSKIKHGRSIMEKVAMITHAAEEEVILKSWAALLKSYSDMSHVRFATVKVVHAPERDDSIVKATWLGDEIFPASLEYAPMAQCKPSDVKTCVVIDVKSATTPYVFDFVLTVEASGLLRNIELAFCTETVHPEFGSMLWCYLVQLLDLSLHELSSDEPVHALTIVEKGFITSNLTKQLPTCSGNLVTHLTHASHDKHSIAVSGWDGSLTYEELLSRSENLAKRLIALGVRKQDVVPVLFEKSIWVAVAVLAILRTGAGFLPLGIAQPSDRHRQILETVNARYALASELQGSKISGLVEHVEKVSADTCQTSGGASWDVALPEIHADDIACVLFTSGSTGIPKGMIIKHGSIFTHVKAFGERVQLHEPRLFQFSAHTWDVFVIDLFTAWLHDGCVCIPSDHACRTNPSVAAGSLQVDVAILTPSIASIFEPQDIPSLRQLIVGGESLNHTVVQKWSNVRRTKVTQMYGPAETGICIVGDQAFQGSQPCTLGTPLANSLCLLIDPDHPDRLARVGAVGELVVAGPSLAVGYLGDREENNAAFLPRPSWAKDLDLQSTVFYRTGDLLQYNVKNMDGTFDFVGRVDTQIKHHGQRLEAGEIEHHIRTFSGVNNCVVIIPARGHYQGRLLAVIQEGYKISVSSESPLELVESERINLELLVSHLKNSLPEYMIPNSLVLVNRLPLTDSGKLDRKHLLTWLESCTIASSVGEEALELLNPEEETAMEVSRICAEIMCPDDDSVRAALSAKNIGLYEVGMDSIQSISFAQTVTKHFNVNLRHEILQSKRTTSRDIAAAIDGRTQSTARSNATISIQQDICPLSKAKDLEEQFLFDWSRKNQDVRMKNVFLTGATGYLGMEILHQLLQFESTVVFALVRADSDSQAQTRLIDGARRLAWWEDHYKSRLHAWPGELGRPRFGLSEGRFDQLCGRSYSSAEQIHVFIHNGANVNYRMNYEDLESENVLSTVELLKCAHRNQFLRRFVFVSGGQIDLAKSQLQVLDEQVSSSDGYMSTKLVSEALIHLSASRKNMYQCDFALVKPGFLIGDIYGSLPRRHDFLWRLVQACVAVKGYDTEESQCSIFLDNVKSVAHRTLEIALGNVDAICIYASEAISLSTFWQAVQEATGVQMSPLPTDYWMSKIRKDLNVREEQHSLFAFTHLVDAGQLKLGSSVGPHANETMKSVRASLVALVEQGVLKGDE